MKEDKDFLAELFDHVSIRVGRPAKHLMPFQQEMRKNWYDSLQAVKDITDTDFQKMNIPLRVVTAIREEISIIINPNSQVQTEVQPQKMVQTNQNVQPIGITVPKKEGNKLTQKSMLQLVRNLQDGLLMKYPWVGEELIKIFSTLQKIIKNILSDPYELKFRVLKKSNQKIRQIIFDNAVVVVFLKEIGFEQDEESIMLDRFETHQLYFIDQCLEAVLENQKSQNGQQNKHFNHINTNKKEENLFLPADIKFPQNKDSTTLENQFTKQNLEEANYAEVLQKLMAYRSQLMLAAPKDRKLRIYHKKYEIKQTNFESYNIEEEIQQSDSAVLGKYLKEVLKNSQKKANFQSRRKTQFQFLIKQRVYKQALIKVKLPNEFIIQARFGPLQTLSNVFSLVSEIVIGDIYMFQTPPVKRLEKDMSKTLMQLDSVPNGSFYLGINSEWYIKNEYLSIIQK